MSDSEKEVTGPTDRSTNQQTEATEKRLEKLEAENRQLREEVNELKSALSKRVDGSETSASNGTDTDGSDAEEVEDGSVVPDVDLSRRGIMAGIAGLGLLGAGGSTASASAPISTLQTTLEFGGSYSGTTSNGYGLKLVEESNSGSKSGIQAETNSPRGQGVFGVNRNKNNTNPNYGVNGVSIGPKGVGVRGKAPTKSGETIGLLGVAEAPLGRGLEGTNFATTGQAVALQGRTESKDGVAVRGRATAGSGTNYGVVGRTNSPDGYGMYTPDDVQVDGDITCSGQKNFVQAVQTDQGPKDVVYTAIEDGDVRTEHSDVTSLDGNRTEIELPDHFSMVTSRDEELVVQTTRYDDCPSLKVVDRSVDRIVVETDTGKSSSGRFAYTVKGIREGFEEEEIIKEPGTVGPDKPSF